MQWIDGVRDTLRIDDYQCPRVQGNEISLGNLELPAIGQMDRKRLEPILNTSLDLGEHQLRLIPWMLVGKRAWFRGWCP